jgi:hypothetical protein
MNRYGAFGAVFTAAIRFGLFANSWRQIARSGWRRTPAWICGLSPRWMCTRPSGWTMRNRMLRCGTSTSFLGSGSTMLQTALLVEHRRDEEEDQQQERDVGHGRRRDLARGPVLLLHQSHVSLSSARIRW